MVSEITTKKKIVILLFIFTESDASMEQLAASYRSFRLNELQYGKTYVFAIKPLFGEMEGPEKTLTQSICENL